MPPPLWAAELPLMVLFTIVALPWMPPPLVSAELALRVLLTIVTWDEELWMPPPKLAELPLMVLLITVTSAKPGGKKRGSKNTTTRLTAYSGTLNRRGRGSLGSGITNTDVVVVADITIDDR
jgi:hypothetical protein